MPREPALRNTCRCPRTSLPQRALHPTDHVQQDIHPTDNPPPSARKSGAVEARRRVGRRRGRLPSSTRQNLRALAMQSSAPAPRAPSPWDSALGATEDSITQRKCQAKLQSARGGAAKDKVELARTKVEVELQRRGWSCKEQGAHEEELQRTRWSCKGQRWMKAMVRIARCC